MNKYLKRYYLRMAVIILGILASVYIMISGYITEVISAIIDAVIFFSMLGAIIYVLYEIIRDIWTETVCRKVLKTDKEFEWYKQYSWHIFSSDPWDYLWLRSDERTPEELELIKRLCEAAKIDYDKLMEEAKNENC